MKRFNIHNYVFILIFAVCIFTGKISSAEDWEEWYWGVEEYLYYNSVIVNTVIQIAKEEKQTRKYPDEETRLRILRNTIDEVASLINQAENLKTPSEFQTYHRLTIQLLKTSHEIIKLRMKHPSKYADKLWMKLSRETSEQMQEGIRVFREKGAPPELVWQMDMKNRYTREKEEFKIKRRADHRQIGKIGTPKKAPEDSSDKEPFYVSTGFIVFVLGLIASALIFTPFNKFKK